MRRSLLVLCVLALLALSAWAQADCPVAPLFQYIEKTERVRCDTPDCVNDPIPCSFVCPDCTCDCSGTELICPQPSCPQPSCPSCPAIPACPTIPPCPAVPECPVPLVDIDEVVCMTIEGGYYQYDCPACEVACPACPPPPIIPPFPLIPPCPVPICSPPVIPPCPTVPACPACPEDDDSDVTKALQHATQRVRTLEWVLLGLGIASVVLLILIIFIGLCVVDFARPPVSRF